MSSTVASLDDRVYGGSGGGRCDAVEVTFLSLAVGGRFRSIIPTAATDDDDEDDDDTPCTVPHVAAADGSALSDGTEKNIKNNNNKCLFALSRVRRAATDDYHDRDYDRRRPGPLHWCSVRKRPPPQTVVFVAPTDILTVTPPICVHS